MRPRANSKFKWNLLQNSSHVVCQTVKCASSCCAHAPVDAHATTMPTCFTPDAPPPPRGRAWKCSGNGVYKLCCGYLPRQDKRCAWNTWKHGQHYEGAGNLIRIPDCARKRRETMPVRKRACPDMSRPSCLLPRFASSYAWSFICDAILSVNTNTSFRNYTLHGKRVGNGPRSSAIAALPSLAPTVY